eukprot:g13272.t1
MKTMYNILKQGVALGIPESAPAVSQFIQKYERLQKLSAFGTYRFSTPDDFIDKINYLQNDVSKTNHTFSINKWNFVDTCTFMGEYFSDKQMTATQSDLDFIEETKDQKAAEPKPINYGGQNNVPGRLRKSYQWQKRRNAYLRPHPLNSTVARQVLKVGLRNPYYNVYVKHQVPHRVSPCKVLVLGVLFCSLTIAVQYSTVQYLSKVFYHSLT